MIPRRTFLKITGSALLANSIINPALTRTASAAASSDRPNVLIFFADDQRAGTIAALGNPHIHTPNLNQLAQRGTAFTRAYMLGSMIGATCVPSRAMLMTGRHLFHLRSAGHSFSPDDQTLPETLRKAGYFTWFSGKRHSLTRKMLQRSFDDGGIVMGFGGYLTDKRRMPVHDWDPQAQYAPSDAYIVSGEPGHPHRSVPSMAQKDSIPPGPYSTELYVNCAVDTIKSHRAPQPWMMYIPLSAPHDPHEAPESFRRLYDPKKIPLPENFLPQHPFDNGDLDVRDEKLCDIPRNPDVIKQRIADYYAAISFLDDQFGRLVKALKETQQLDNTIIIFAGDSGLAIGQHGLLGKQNLYDDGGVHVPLIMAGPGIPSNQRRDGLAATIDIFPTVCELTGTEAPSTLDGTSLVPLLKNPEHKVHDCLYLGYREYQRAVIESRYKLIEYVAVPQTKDGQSITRGSRNTQLFDLLTDPLETQNLAGLPQYTATLRRLQSRMLTLRYQYHDATEKGLQLAPEMQDQYQRFWDNYQV